MRIITFVAASTPTPAARIALEFCVAARELGHEPVLAGLVRSRGTPGLTDLGAAADAAQVTFRLLQQRHEYDPGLIGQMEMMFRRLKPDCYLSHDFAGALLAWLARYRPARIAAFAHTGSPALQKMESAWLGRRLLRKADALITDAQPTAKRLRELGVRQIILTGPGTDWIKETLHSAHPL